MLKNCAPPAPDSLTSFSYLLQEGFTTPKLTEEGLHSFPFQLLLIPF